MNLCNVFKDIFVKLRILYNSNEYYFIKKKKFFSQKDISFSKL